MKLTVREAAEVLRVSETRIYRWVADEEIPFVMIQHHPMFHRVELLEWAMAMELAVSADLYEHEHAQPFARALERGGARVLDGDAPDVASDLPLPAEDRELVRGVLAARGRAMFVHRTADHIAIPRAQSPIIGAGTTPAVLLWWCAPRPVTIADTPANAIFLIVAPTIKQHHQLLSRLSLALHDRAVREALLRPRDLDRALAEVRRWEHAIEEAVP